MTIYDIALSLLRGVKPEVTWHLLEKFGSSRALFNASADDLQTIAQLNRAGAEKILLLPQMLPQAQKEIEFMDANGIRAIAFDDDQYPQALRGCDNAPVVLYTKGDIDFNRDKWLAVVGTRKPSQYGITMCERVVADLAQAFPELVIVSGMAFGIDITAHKSAMRSGLRTVGVLAQNLSTVYPAAHTNAARDVVACGGALVSEAYSGTVIEKYHFLMRNRIIAGLCSGTLVVESAERGGALSTAHAALGRGNVMAVPGRATDPCSAGCNKLIKRNVAALVESAQDIAECMGWESAGKSQHTDAQLDLFSLTPEEQRVIAAMGVMEKRMLPDLERAAGIDPRLMPITLVNLELKGIVKAIQGNMYMRIK